MQNSSARCGPTWKFGKPVSAVIFPLFLLLIVFLSGRVLVGKHDGRRPHERPRSRWENIKMDVKRSGLTGTDLINLAEDRDMWRAFVNAVMNFRVS